MTGNEEMKRLIAAFAVAVAISSAFSGEVVPTLQELRKTPEVKVEALDEAPVMPNSVNPEKQVRDLARLCPPDAVWFVSAPDTNKLSGDWSLSPPGKFLDEPSVQRTIRNNKFGLNFLFLDLPESVITPDRVGSIASSMDLAAALADVSQKMAMAGYVDAEGRFSFAFLFDVGLDRVPAFEIMTDWETSFYVAYPGADVVRGDHSGNFIDVWTLRSNPNTLLPASVAAGFAENVAIVSNDEALARRCLGLLNGGDAVASSTWGRRLAASMPSASSVDIVGYLRMDTLLESLKNEPIARQMVTSWADYVGYGGKDGEALYYGLQFTPDGSRETILLPVSSQPASSSLIELLAKRLRPASKWTAPSVMPYQPNPVMFIGAQLEGRQLGGLLRQERRLFGLSGNAEYFSMPQTLRRLFTNDVVAALSGEVGIAFYPEGNVSLAANQARKEQGEVGPPWLMVLPCTENPERKLPRAETQVERTGAMIYSRSSDWRNTASWTVISNENFRRGSGHFLVIASTGDLVLSVIDQLVSGSSFADNKDFAGAVAKTEAGHGMIFYVNMPEIAVRLYPNLSYIMRSLYPRSSGFNSRPPLMVVRRYAKGVLGAISPSNSNNGGGNGGNGGNFTRMTIQAPIPMLGALTAGIVLRFPMSMRADGRQAMEKSRQNLQALWLRIQLYSSRFGHFPESLDMLMSEMRTTMQPDEVQSTFIAPAALSRMKPSQAVLDSYHYMSGATPNDEPDLPLLYEAEPWSEDFSGMFSDDPNRAPTESGSFEAYRQYIRLDGRVVVMPEKIFKDRVLPRLRERE